MICGEYNGILMDFEPITLLMLGGRMKVDLLSLINETWTVIDLSSKQSLITSSPIYSTVCIKQMLFLQ